MKPQIIQQGAEAIIYLDNGKIKKHRVKKSYRLKELDEKLRKQRTKSEAKIIDKLNNIIPVPKLIETDEKNKLIIMEYIDGLKLSDNLEKLNWKEICKDIGKIISKLHDNNIIHGDLTTSNMIYVENPDTNDKTNKNSSSHSDLSINNKNQLDGKYPPKNSIGKIYLIDFGLSFHSHKIEDKAVDIHLLKQALEAKHFKIAEQSIIIILKNYKPKRYKEILEQLKKVESRGRYKEKH